MTGRLKEADERTKRELADKCQENGWLRRGGYPWQDDPYLEEYPYEFAKAGSVEELRGFFAHGNWRCARGSCTRISPSCSRSTAATSGGR